MNAKLKVSPKKAVVGARCQKRGSGWWWMEGEVGMNMMTVDEQTGDALQPSHRWQHGETRALQTKETSAIRVLRDTCLETKIYKWLCTRGELKIIAKPTNDGWKKSNSTTSPEEILSSHDLFGLILGKYHTIEQMKYGIDTSPGFLVPWRQHTQSFMEALCFLVSTSPS